MMMDSQFECNDPSTVYHLNCTMKIHHLLRRLTHTSQHLTHVVAQYPVSSFSIDPTGRILLVGTTYGTVEVWQTGMDPYMNSTLPKRLRILSVYESFMKRHRSKTMDERSRYSSCNNHEADVSLYSVDDVDTNGIGSDNKPSTIECDDNATETQDDLA